ncbi:hypothetical protein [Luteococcus peritonei]|uniref:Uncharacterized protein n=1 Tax=Luteococcus peritonei TaxID=88874 RepID=A0ABW4RYS6_9ACTN
MSQFNENETEAIRGGVMGAIALVSQAEPGFFATFKESMAASNALKGAPEDFRKLMTGGIVMPPQAGSKEEMTSKLLANLGTAVQTASKDPATLQALQQYVNAAVQEVAQAAKGVSPEETAVIEQVQQVLQQGGQAQQASPQLQADPSQQAPAAGAPQVPNQAPGAPQAESPFQRPADQA